MRISAKFAERVDEVKLCLVKKYALHAIEKWRKACLNPIPETSTMASVIPCKRCKSTHWTFDGYKWHCWNCSLSLKRSPYKK